MDWNDLPYFLAMARHGGALAGARALGVDATTLRRRVAALERDLGLALVERGAAGYGLTPFGAALLPHAERVAQSVQALEDALGAARAEVAGVVRVTCPEPLVRRLAGSDLLDRFHARHPGLRVEFVVSDRYVDLVRGDADIALRSGDTDDGELVGRKIGDSYWAVYASTRYVREHGQPRDLAELASHPLIGLDESMARHRAATWLREVAPQARIVARTGSVLGLVDSAKAGLGLAPLPTALGDAEPDLVRVLGPVEALTRIWRVLVAPAQRRVPRVAAFFDFVVAEIEALRPILSG